MFFQSIIPVHANACSSSDDPPIEIYLELRVENLLTFDLDGYLCGETLYIPVSEFSSRLHINHTFSNDRSQLNVVLPDGKNSFMFDFSKLSVQSAKGVIRFEETDLLYPNESREIFIRKDLLEEIFLVQLHFNHSGLILSLFSEYDLPVINDHKRRLRYDQFKSPQQDFSPDIEYSANRSILNGWVIDWNLNSSHSQSRQNFSYGVTTGGHILGGDLFFSSRGTAAEGIIKESLRGQWRYPVYSTPVLRQIVVGDQMHQNIFGEGISQFRGMEITNSPNAPRQYFHDFRISDHIKEGWDIEMYSNNILTGLARGDDRITQYSFSEPLRYGSNRFSLRHYSPNGFSHEDIYVLTVPGTLLPPGSFEYSLSAGNYLLASDAFVNAQVNMGISSFLTLGGGYHVSNPFISGYKQTPYLTSSLQIAKRLILEGSHTFGYTSEGSLRYYFSNGRSVSVKGRKFYGASHSNRFHRNIEGSINTSFPLDLGLFKLSTFINTRGAIYSQHQDINVDVGFTASIPFGYILQLRSANMFRNFQEGEFTRVRSDLSLTASKMILRKIIVRPSIDYNQRSGKISGYRLEASSWISRNADFGISAHHDPLIGLHRFQFNFRFNFPFGRYRSQVHTTNSGNTSMNQAASGSIVLDTKRGDLHTFDRNQTRSASLRLEPYLILDDKDSQELIKVTTDLFKATLYVDGNKQATQMDGDIIRNLVPYQIYHIYIEADNLDNPLWRLDSQQFQIQVIPHVMNRLPIPIIAVGEVSGRIHSTDNELSTSLSNLSVKIEEIDGPFKETVRTYSSGQFYYVGLMPGAYTVSLDPEELSGRKLISIQENVSFTIEPTPNGDIVDQLSLTVKSDVGTLDIDMVLSEIFMVQVGAFRNKKDASAITGKLDLEDSYRVEIAYDPKDQIYRSRIGNFKSKEDAKNFLHDLKQTDNALFQDAFIIRLDL